MTRNPMPLEAISPTFREAVAMHEALRRLGIPPQELYVTSNQDEQPGAKMAVAIVQQGEIRIMLPVGRINRNEAVGIEHKWAQVIRWWNGEVDQQVRSCLMDESVVMANSVPLVTVLTQAGLYPRKPGRERSHG